MSSAKDHLLETAIRIFSERGFRDTTIADISRVSGANIAAVNYHFGSKEKLFRAALCQSYQTAESIHPVTGNLPSDAPVGDRIAAFSRALLRRCFDSGPAGDFDRIMSRTLPVPGSPLPTIFEEVNPLALDQLNLLLKQILPGAVISQARAILIAMATTPLTYGEVLNPDFPRSPEEIEDFISRQVHAINTALHALAP